MTGRVLLAGCGDLGIRLARRLTGWQVIGLRRDPSRLPAGIVPVQADLARPETLGAVAGAWDAVVMTATPDARTPQAYRAAYVDSLQGLLARVRARRLVFVSSTAVYGQADGAWVDEDSPAEPAAFNGRVLLEAEALAADAGGIMVRFSGIYGPGRDWLLRKLRQGPVECRRTPPEWTNRIHSEDCAGVLAHVLTLDEPARLYNASDCEPAARWDVLGWLASRMNVAGPVEANESDPAPDLGKRINNRRLLDSGFRFQYPDFRAGYEEMLE